MFDIASQAYEVCNILSRTGY